MGAAAVTLLVVIGVLAGPSVVACFNSDENMGMCLRGKMADAGLVSRPATAVADIAAPADEPEVAVTPEPETDVEPAAADTAEPDDTAGSDQAVPDDLIAATFGLLRAEPDGSVVIAGSGTPGTEVEVFSNGSLLGRATVESSGDWVLVPDVPIPPGGTEITLGEVGKTGRAERSFVVAINEDKTSEPLVVASTPGAASEILQGLDRTAAETTTQLAAADPVDSPAPEPEPSPTATADVTEPVETPAERTEPAVPAEQSSATPEPAAATPEEPAAPADTADSSAPAPGTVPEPAVTAPAAPEPVADPAAPEPTPPLSPEPQPEPEPDTTEPAAPRSEPAVEPASPPEPDTAVAAVDEPVSTPAPANATAPQVAAVPPTIDAIEIEGERTYFAGGGPEGATMRLYVDDTFIADAEVTDGRWLVEAGAVLGKPSQRIRIDMLEPGSADVAARAEVNFVVELPAQEPPIAVAEAPETEPQQSVPQAVPETTAPVEASPQPQPEPVGSQPVAPAAAPQPEPPATAAAEPATGPAATGQDAPAAPAASQEPAADAPSAPSVQTPADAPVDQAEPDPSEQPADSPPASPQPESDPAVPDEAPGPETATEDVPTMVAVAFGDPDAQRFASGKAIIRRGDNLWTIARRVYGQGIKYTTIYEANTGQIRDPDRIYPGQVFDLPGGEN